MSNAEDLDFEIILSARQLGAPPERRHVPVTLRDWPTVSGKAARFLVWELTASAFADFQETGRTYKDGSYRYELKDEDFRLLAYTVCDPQGNRLWNTTGEAISQLGRIGRASLSQLLNAANEVNSVKSADAEGNSGATPSDSSPTT